MGFEVTGAGSFTPAMQEYIKQKNAAEAARLAPARDAAQNPFAEGQSGNIIGIENPKEGQIDFNMLTQLQNRAGQTQMGQQRFLNALMPQQQALAQQMAAQATGGTMSPALRLAMQQNMSAQAGLAKSQRGVNPALAARNANMANTQLQQNTMLGGVADAQNQFNNMMGQNQQYNLGLQNSLQNASNAYQNGILGQATQNFNSANGPWEQQRNSIIGGAIGGGANALMTAKAQGGMIGYAQGGMAQSSCAGQYLNMQMGGRVPGQAAVPGNSYSNDTQPALLSPGEAVIPRNIMQSTNPGMAAKRFVDALIAKHGKPA
jgi:hypothetical protein